VIAWPNGKGGDKNPAVGEVWVPSQREQRGEKVVLLRGSRHFPICQQHADDLIQRQHAGEEAALGWKFKRWRNPHEVPDDTYAIADLDLTEEEAEAHIRRLLGAMEGLTDGFVADLMAEHQRGLQEIREGKGVPLEQLRKDLRIPR